MIEVVQRALRAMSRPALPAILVVVLVCIGCGTRRTPPPVETADSEPSPATEQAETQIQNAQTGDTPAEIQEAPEDPSPESQTEPQQAVDPADLRSVGPQDARRGSTITGGGIISEPLRQNFLIQHRIVFLNLKRAERLYEAEQGRMPGSHEEYMQEIVEKNLIELPELHPGWDYYYDATDGELKQRRVE